MIIVALIGWTTAARLVRAETLSLKRARFRPRGTALGARPERIMLRHILPNAAGSLIVATTLSVGNADPARIGAELPRPRHPAAGGELGQHADRRAGDCLQQAPVLALWPGLLIFLTVIAFNFVGDGLQDALDPRSERR